MPEKTKNYNLNIFDESDGEEFFLDYRLDISGTSEDSNFVIIDGVLASLQTQINEIPGALIATTETAGIVKGSTADDMVNVNTDGTMVMNRLNTMKLYNNSTDELILSSGQSNI